RLPPLLVGSGRAYDLRGGLQVLERREDGVIVGALNQKHPMNDRTRSLGPIPITGIGFYAGVGGSEEARVSDVAIGRLATVGSTGAWAAIDHGDGRLSPGPAGRPRNGADG